MSLEGVVTLLASLGIVLGIFRLVPWIGRRRRVRGAKSEPPAQVLDRAELCTLQGAWQAAVDLAAPLLSGSAVARLDPEAIARAHLVLAECLAAGDRRDEAAEHVHRAGTARSRMPAGEARARLVVRERFVQAGLGRSDAPGEREWPSADAVLAEAESDRGLEPAQAIRLARLALWRAEAEIREGSWPRARAHLEQAVRLGEQVPVAAPPGRFGPAGERDELLGALARSRASAAAGEIAAVLASLGRHEEAIAWLDRAVAVCEGARLAPGRIALARARIVRAMNEPADAVLGSEPRRRRLVAAREGVAGNDWPAARALVARADIQLGVLAAQEGDVEGAKRHLLAASRGLRGLELPGVAELVTEAHLLLGHVLEDHGGLDEARIEYRRALDTGREDADPDARRLAAVAGCHLHRLLHHADRADEARALLEPLESLAPTLAPAARPLVAAMVARCRGQQQFRDGERDAADRSLAGAMALVDAASGPEAIDLARQIASERGNLALAADRPREAEGHFRRALAAVGGTRPAAIEQAEHAETHLRLAQSLLQQDRPGDARPELSAAFEGGRDSGRANGRSVAAAAALLRGDDPESPLAERRRWYESAARFGRLSGTERGRQVEAAVAERLRELQS